MDLISSATSIGDITIKPLDAPLGAQVFCGPVDKLSADEREVIHQAWLDHLILVFPGQNLSPEEQIAATPIFGPVAAVFMKGGEKEITTVTNIGPMPLLGNAELLWHSDQSFEDIPISASMLFAIEIPEVGGDTYWNNMYLAYETLPPALRARVQGLTIKNDISTNSAGQRVMRIPETTDVRLSKGPSHPIVRTHPETGLNALYLGRRPFAYVNGMPVEESEALLNELWAHATNPALEYRHHWTPGDLMVWDNRAVMHKRDAFDENLRRVLNRTQSKGCFTYYDPTADARGFHPRGHLRA